MGKDYITITKADGSSEQMEVVAAFRLEASEKDCIIYKSSKEDRYFAASYTGDLEYANLDTNFTDSEKEQLNNIFKALNYGGDTNA